jgi:23S rRNA (guanosine2251-2'-O)-methyltransferase
MNKKYNQNSTTKKPKPTSITNNHPSNIANNHILIYGKHPCILAIKHRTIHQVFCSPNNEKLIKETLQQCNKSTNLLKIVDNSFLDKLVGNNSLHQGIVIEANKINIQDQFQLLQKLHNMQEQQIALPNLLMLDQLCDPHNIGAIIRSAVAFGINHIVFSKHNSCPESATMIKSSAGNIEFAHLFEATNFNDLLNKLKDLGYWSAALSINGNCQLQDLHKYLPLAIVIGSEGFGIRKLVEKNCDLKINIPTNPQVESLNVSVATSILLHKINEYSQ